MSQNVTKLTPAQTKAAKLLAEDKYGDEDIAQMCGVNRRTLARWKEISVFAEQVDNVREALRQEILKTGIADVVVRVQRRQRDWELLEQVRQERSGSEEFRGVAGGTTGLLVRRLKQIGSGQNAETVEEFVIDHALLDQRLRLEEAVQKDLGQIVDKLDLTTGGKTFGFSVDETERHIAEILKRRGSELSLSTLPGRVRESGLGDNVVE